MITPEISPTVSTAVTINMISTGAMARISNTEDFGSTENLLLAIFVLVVILVC